jgi:iron complex outermembrane receptor protein
VARNVFTYITSRRGYREGGINGPIFNSPTALSLGLNRFQTYKPEIVTDLEVGAKTDWRIGEVRGRFNIAVFREWYKDAVNYINVTGTSLTSTDPSYPDRGSFGFNAAKLTITGVEVDGNISPTPGLIFSASGSYLKQKVDSVENVDPFPPVTVTLPSPKWSFSAAADFSPQTKVFGGDLNFHFDYYWLDNYQVQTGTFPGYKLANARIDLRDIEGSSISAGFFMKNFFNNHYLVSPVIALPQYPANIGNPGEPRTFGVELSYKF